MHLFVRLYYDGTTYFMQNHHRKKHFHMMDGNASHSYFDASIQGK